MTDLRPAPHVHQHYPDAIPATLFLDAFRWYVRKQHGIAEDRIACLTSVCSDDLNSVEFPETGMIGPFILGGLDGYPFVGKTGLAAFSHHIPNKGAALLFFGPHVGITNSGLVGKVVRPGQSSPSSCCGAAMAGLQKLLAGQIVPKEPAGYAVDDYQQETLEQILYRHRTEIVGSESADDAGRFLRMTEILYREMKQAFASLLTSVEFEAPAFVFGGILINEDGGKDSSISMRDVFRVDHREFIDLTPEFRERSAAKFQEFQAGQHDTFR